MQKTANDRVYYVNDRVYYVIEFFSGVVALICVHFL